MTILRRGDTLYLKRRVPRRYQSVEPRVFLRLSLTTDSMEVAKAKAPRIWSDMIETWEARLAGDEGDAEARLRAARNLAAARGFRFLTAAEVATAPEEEFLARIEAVQRASKPGRPDLAMADALLGTLDIPVPRVSGALAAYWEVAKAKAIGKSQDQVRRWKNPRKKAFANFLSVIPDKPITEVTTQDLWRFRSWWVDKIEAEGLTPNSANKDFIHVTSTLRLVARSRGITVAFSTEGLALSDGEKRIRPPFSREWIATRLLAPGALDGLNPEARAILLGMVNTGYRPSEGASLTAAQIHLDAPVPHISIEPVGRQLKSKYARRNIPLLGVSLEAFKAFPKGFPRYAENPALSDTVNKFLRENGLLETPAHSFYSLRHGFEDRMLAAGIDERIRRDLMGHRLTRERYGEGASLELMAKALGPVAI